MVNELQSEASEKLDLDVTDEQIVAEMSQKKVDKANELKAMQQNQQQPFGRPVQNSEIKLEDTPMLMIYDDELNVNFADIKMKLIKSDQDAKDILSRKLEEQKNGIVDQYLNAMRSGKKAILKTNVSLEEGSRTKYSQELQMVAEDILNYGKITAAQEMGKTAPNTTKAEHDALLANINLILNKQENDLDFRLKQVANNALDANMPENQVRLLIEKEYESFWKTVLLGTVASVVPTYLNKGRQITFDKYSGDIFAYRYTAVMEDETCEYCKALHGRVFQANDPEYIMLTPPNHYNCHCVWTQIPQSMSNGIMVNGKPNDVTVYSSINTFKDIQMSETEQLIDKLLKS
jgi:SPP1 gp7 family putative phage head morphogenesis protein